MGGTRFTVEIKSKGISFYKICSYSKQQETCHPTPTTCWRFNSAPRADIACSVFFWRGGVQRIFPPLSRRKRRFSHSVVAGTAHSNVVACALCGLLRNGIYRNFRNGKRPTGAVTSAPARPLGPIYCKGKDVGHEDGHDGNRAPIDRFRHVGTADRLLAILVRKRQARQNRKGDPDEPKRHMSEHYIAETKPFVQLQGLEFFPWPYSFSSFQRRKAATVNPSSISPFLFILSRSLSVTLIQSMIPS